MVWSLCLEVDVRRSNVNEILATVRYDSTDLETNVEESKAKIVSALREYFCSTFFEEDKQRMIAKQLDTD